MAPSSGGKKGLFSASKDDPRRVKIKAFFPLSSGTLQSEKKRREAESDQLKREGEEEGKDFFSYLEFLPFLPEWVWRLSGGPPECLLDRQGLNHLGKRVGGRQPG